MSTIKAIILGIVQGLTEFLPVSSSGHLALTQNLLNVPEERVMFLTVLLHFGTLLSIFVVYWQDILMMIQEFLKMLWELCTGKGFNIANQHRRMALFIIVATIPTGVIGVLFEDLIESIFTSTIVVGFGLLLTGTLLWISERIHRGDKGISQMKWSDAAMAGVFQGMAIVPGLSRSGSTIVGSLFMGLNKELATKFSFFISIPVILGATILEVKDAVAVGLGDITFTMLLAGVAAAFISGLIAIRSLINLVKKSKLHYFSYYTWTLGGIIVIMNLIR